MQGRGIRIETEVADILWRAVLFFWVFYCTWIKYQNLNIIILFPLLINTLAENKVERKSRHSTSRSRRAQQTFDFPLLPKTTQVTTTPSSRTPYQRKSLRQTSLNMQSFLCKGDEEWKWEVNWTCEGLSRSCYKQLCHLT